jgi:hypothetical protein
MGMFDIWSSDPTADNGGGSYNTGGNPVDTAYNDASGPPPGSTPTDQPGIYQNPDGSFWFSPVTVTENTGTTSNSTGGISPSTFDALANQSDQASLVLDALNQQLPDKNTVPTPANSGMAAIQDAAKVAASRGVLDQFMASNPIYAANIDPSLMPSLQATNQSVQVNTATRGAGLTPAPSNTSNVNTSPSNYTAPDSNFGSPGLNSAIGAFTTSGPQGALGTTPDPYAGTTPVGAGNTDGSNVVTLGYANPDQSYQIGGSQNLVGQFTVNGPVAYKNGLGTPYGNTTPIYDEPATTADTSTSTTPPLTVAKKPSSNNIDTFNTPVDVGSGGDTAMSSTGYTKDTATSSTGYDKNAPTDNLGIDLPFGIGSPIGADGNGISSATPIDTTTSPTTDATAATSAGAPSLKRKYLGASDDPYHYGFGAEHQYYGLVPAAAQGGYFDSEQYFADGGLVSPSSQPEQPLMATQPTMAFTDGVGAIGSIAQPPGLSSQDSFGFDTDTASPMAPSPAAAPPSVMSPLQSLSAKNVNGVPAPSPIAQNPNVGYALGKSPLSNL